MPQAAMSPVFQSCDTLALLCSFSLFLLTYIFCLSCLPSSANVDFYKHTCMIEKTRTFLFLTSPWPDLSGKLEPLLSVECLILAMFQVQVCVIYWVSNYKEKQCFSLKCTSLWFLSLSFKEQMWKSCWRSYLSDMGYAVMWINSDHHFRQS